MSEALQFNLEVFQGPLDLLLHLIEKNKINIYDIPIVTITDQYLEYIAAMQERDMDITSEFLVMAATLINIKSKMLLPAPEPEEGEEEPVDPRAELVQRLLEYKMYKYISEELKDKQIDATKSFFKGSSIPQEIRDYRDPVDVSELLSDLTLNELHSIFESVIKKQEDKVDPIRSKFGRIEHDEISIAGKIMEIQQFGFLHRHFSFRNMLEKQHTKSDVIVTFLGILELMKMGQIKVSQKEVFDDIEIDFIADSVLPVERFQLDE
ncbi:MAG: segregation/condensation protein A [Lachnospiraceae bacterium]|nr:segregation/condensation protein A [Lachnospiraceae bacterium]MBP5184267.1 segregation/condensation protein A [Lachnospiraceae bacterium]